MLTADRRVRACEVRELEQCLGVIVGRLDPDAMPFSEACDVWAAFDAVERLAVTAKILMARRVEDAGAWKRAGSRSPAEQMAKLAGTSSSAAKRMLDTSKRVRKLPKTAQAMRAGKLSSAKADAIADAAAITPDAEDGLLDGADTKTLADVREACLRAKAIDRDAADARIHRQRRLTQHKDGEGGLERSRAGHDGSPSRVQRRARADRG